MGGGLLERPSTPLPKGFRADPNRGGLIVPEEESRLRIVLTEDDRRALDRAIERVLAPHRIKFLLLCDVEDCPDPKIVRVNQADGSYVLRCGHADRVLMKDARRVLPAAAAQRRVRRAQGFR